MPTRSDRRTKILEAAAACFGRYGYAKTTLDDIGRAARLNKTSLYYYFPSKDELFMTVVLTESTAFMQALAERVRQRPSPAEQVREYLLERLRYYRQVLDRHALSQPELQTLEPRFEALYAEVREREVAFLADLLLPLLPPTEPPAPGARRLANLLLSAADAFKHAAVREAPAPASPNFDAAEADTRLLVELIIRGLRK